MDRIVSVSTMAFDGWSLERALDELADLGVKYVEPASVNKVFEHLTEEDFCDRCAHWLLDQLSSRGLKSYSLSAHMDLTEEDSVPRFGRRLEFARTIGAQCVNTSTGPAGNLLGFRTNIPAIARHAEDLGLVVALENHGDLLNRGQQLVEFIHQIGHPAIRLNYDTGNAWYYACGALNPAEELREVSSVVAHIHLKSPKLEERMMRWVALGDGILDMRAVGKVLKERLPGIPVSFELSPRQRSYDFEPRWRAPDVPALDGIRGVILQSLKVIQDVLA